MKSYRWYVHFPGEAYANDMRFDHPATETEAREYVRDWLGVKRLPRGTQVWPAQPLTEEEMRADDLGHTWVWYS